MTSEQAICVIQAARPMKGPNSKMINDALDFAIAALRDQENRRWIPVTERLPDIGRKCLIANSEIVARGWLRPDGVWKTGVSSDEVWGKFSLHQPTHWMPLPEPPEEDV